MGGKTAPVQFQPKNVPGIEILHYTSISIGNLDGDKENLAEYAIAGADTVNFSCTGFRNSSQPDARASSAYVEVRDDMSTYCQTNPDFNTSLKCNPFIRLHGDYGNYDKNSKQPEICELASNAMEIEDDPFNELKVADNKSLYGPLFPIVWNNKGISYNPYIDQKVIFNNPNTDNKPIKGKLVDIRAMRIPPLLWIKSVLNALRVRVQKDLSTVLADILFQRGKDNDHTHFENRVIDIARAELVGKQIPLVIINKNSFEPIKGPAQPTFEEKDLAMASKFMNLIWETGSRMSLFKDQEARNALYDTLVSGDPDKIFDALIGMYKKSLAKDEKFMDELEIYGKFTLYAVVKQEDNTKPGGGDLILVHCNTYHDIVNGINQARAEQVVIVPVAP